MFEKKGMLKLSPYPHLADQQGVLDKMGDWEFRDRREDFKVPFEHIKTKKKLPHRAKNTHRAIRPQGHRNYDMENAHLDFHHIEK